MSSFYVSTRFVWGFGGHQVHLCGSFTRWVETVPMAPVEGQPSVFSVVVHLPPGYHQYKFIVDGEWRHDETQPYMPDPMGNVNNWLFVRRPDNPTAMQPQTVGQLPNAPFFPDRSAVLATGTTSVPANQLFTAPLPIGVTAGADLTAQAQGPPRATTPGLDVDMAPAEPSSASDGQPEVQVPNIAMQGAEPEFTRGKVHDFLAAHTAYELIPESGKVVVLDIELPIRQAFHALHEQGIPSAPLWDPRTACIVGMISASDFIHVLRKLRSVSSNGNPMSELEMDQHTIRSLREEGNLEGRPPRELVFCNPEEQLSQVVQRLFQHHCSMAPVLTEDPSSRDCDVLHIATLSGVLACLMRHFRASVSSLPLLSQPLGKLPLGTWAPDSTLVQQEGPQSEGKERRDVRRVRPLNTVRPDTPLTSALQMLLDNGVSVLPVVDGNGVLLDFYARGDISMLAKGNSYSRLQWEDLTVGQALTLANSQWPTTGAAGSAVGPQGGPAGTPAAKQQRVFICTAQDPLRIVVERLSIPGVRRMFVVHHETKKVEGIISLSDVAAFLFLD